MVKANSIYKNLLLCFFVLLFSHIILYNTPLKLPVFILVPAIISYMIYVNGITVTALFCTASLIFNCTTAFCLLELSIYTAAFNALSVLLPGFICGMCISKKLKVSDTIIAVLISVIIFPLIAMAYFKYAENFNFTKEISDIITNDFARQIQLIKSIYPEFAQVFGDAENEIFSTLAISIPGLVPCFIVMLSLLYTVIVYGLSKFFLRRKMIEDLFFTQGLDCIFLPKTTSIALLISLIFMFIETDPLTAMAATNVFIITLLFYMLQGLSLVEYFLKQKNLNSAVRLVALFGIIIILMFASAFMPILNPVFALSFLGMSDSASDYRKLSKNKDELNEN